MLTSAPGLRCRRRSRAAHRHPRESKATQHQPRRCPWSTLGRGEKTCGTCTIAIKSVLSAHTDSSLTIISDYRASLVAHRSQAHRKHLGVHAYVCVWLCSCARTRARTSPLHGFVLSWTAFQNTNTTPRPWPSAQLWPAPPISRDLHKTRVCTPTTASRDSLS